VFQTVPSVPVRFELAVVELNTPLAKEAYD